MTVHEALQNLKVSKKAHWEVWKYMMEVNRSA